MSLGINLSTYQNLVGAPGAGFVTFQHSIAATHTVAIAIIVTGTASTCHWNIFVDNVFNSTVVATNTSTIAIDGNDCVITLIDNTDVTDSFAIYDVITYIFNPID